MPFCVLARRLCHTSPTDTKAAGLAEKAAMAAVRAPRLGQRGLTGPRRGRSAAEGAQGGAGRGDVAAAPSPWRKPGPLSHCNSWAVGVEQRQSSSPCTTADLGQALLLFSVRWGCIVLEFCPSLVRAWPNLPYWMGPLEGRNGTHSPASRSSGVLGTDHTKGPEIVGPVYSAYCWRPRAWDSVEIY